MSSDSSGDSSSGNVSRTSDDSSDIGGRITSRMLSSQHYLHKW